MAKLTFFERISSEEQDYEQMKPFLEYGKGLMLWAVKNMKSLRRKATNTENMVGKYMYHRRIIFISQAPFIFDVGLDYPKCYFADFYIPALHTIIEIDGKRHCKPGQVDYDGVRDKLFSSIGINTIRISSSSVLKGEYKKLIPIPDEKDLRPEKVTYISEDPDFEEKKRILRGALKKT